MAGLNSLFPPSCDICFADCDNVIKTKLLLLGLPICSAFKIKERSNGKAPGDCNLYKKSCGDNAFDPGGISSSNKVGSGEAKGMGDEVCRGFNRGIRYGA